MCWIQYQSCCRVEEVNLPLVILQSTLVWKKKQWVFAAAAPVYLKITKLNPKEFKTHSWKKRKQQIALFSFCHPRLFLKAFVLSDIEQLRPNTLHSPRSS